jgi:uncharacterized protein (UPF0335 family)
MSTETLPEHYDEAVKVVVSSQRASTSFIQRQFSIGYNKAAEIMEAMEANGVVSRPNHAGKRNILIKPEEIAMDAAMGANRWENVPLLKEVDSLSGTAREKLRLTVERIERLEEEKKEIAEQIKEVFGEAKALGYDTKALRSVIKIRKIDRQERQEQEAILEVYLDALGEL